MTSEQSIRVISLRGNLLVFQHKRASPKGSEIALWRLAFGQDSRGFFNKDGRVSSMYKNTREVDMVYCTSAVDIKTRQKVPCVLLRLRKKSSQGFKYMLYSLDSLTRAKLHVELTLPYAVGDDVAIFNGPTLVWTRKGRVLYTSSEVGGVKESPICLKVNFIGELPLYQRRIAILGSETREGLAESSMGNEILLYFLEDGRTFGGTCLLPEAYSSVVCCMVVLSAEEANGSLRSTVLAATCRKQLVRFENGFPEDMCVLPYEQPQSIQLVHARDGGCIIAVVFSHGNVCAVRSDSFEVGFPELQPDRHTLV